RNKNDAEAWQYFPARQFSRKDSIRSSAPNMPQRVRNKRSSRSAARANASNASESLPSCIAELNSATDEYYHGSMISTASRLQIGDTAEFNSALRLEHFHKSCGDVPRVQWTAVFLLHTAT